jgi:pimeloyl-ACP methyl ester carboxylesterase
MARPMIGPAVAGLLLAAWLAGCQADGSADASPAPASVTLADGSLALAWGDGPYGLVLVHGAAYDAASWAPQAVVFADNGMSVLAIEQADAESVEAAIRHLQDGGAERVALLGASAGVAPVLEVGRTAPQLVDQLIVLSGSGDVSGLGDFPKLFAASEGEALAADAERMADEAPGDSNVLYLAEGDAHAQAIFETEAGPALLDAIVQRLEERQ